ncbi:17211_t:CDS:2, partial [Acaulospora colombiana]
GARKDPGLHIGDAGNNGCLYKRTSSFIHPMYFVCHDQENKKRKRANMRFGCPERPSSTQFYRSSYVSSIVRASSCHYLNGVVLSAKCKPAH